ncbi:hypothetical protein N657DRAFT_658669 [Parathielavia appendiculata]|uniref:Zn(2)-C6 fungal-type domain-containing protein n=1 Tax=Parathielavia appendiculata TaxID=2587402 RepID=A0AAN6TSZ7_9PEZI|nr:hypothetical protein N657DRAFT_658669 [Parathielavia appendiculata]
MLALRGSDFRFHNPPEESKTRKPADTVNERDYRHRLERGQADSASGNGSSFRHDPNRRREKRQLSCNLCRRRKLRCDRQQPCSNCSLRQLTCSYPEQSVTASLPSKKAAMHDRIIQLESLVMSLVPGSKSRAMHCTGEQGNGQHDLADPRHSDRHHFTHHLEEEEQFQATQDDHGLVGTHESDRALDAPPSRTLLLYAPHWPISRQEILASLPPKGAVDRYVSRYFNRLDLVYCHVPIAWLGLLFSMICLALLASDVSDTARGDPEHRSLQIRLYRERTSGPYVLETLVHYIYIELNLRGDADKDIWALFALEVNLALRMGYHRDPRHFPGITPLQGEMRRRLWATVLQGDILVSSQMGMPRMISDSKWDTEEPRNLTDADLDESTTDLPPSRPETELTPALGIIARRRMFVALGAVADLTAAVQPCSYAEVVRIDGVLREAAASIPPPLKPKLLTMSVTDPPEVMMSRLFIEHLYFLGQMKLHRRFLYAPLSPHDKDVFAYSRTSCLDACLGALRIHSILDEETCPGGQLHMMRWRMSSIMNHTFLTATMILCSMLHRGRTLEREDEILEALRKARSIWLRASPNSREARKAAETVNLVMAKVRAGHSTQQDRYRGVVENTTHLTTRSDLGSEFGSAPDKDVGGAALQALNMLVAENSSLGDGVFDPDSFVVPDLLETFMPADSQAQTFSSMI